MVKYEKANKCHCEGKEGKCCCCGKWKCLALRAASSVVLAAATVFIVFAGYPLVHVFALIAGALLAYEWANMAPNKKPALYAATYLVGLSVAIFTPYLLVFAPLLAFAAAFAWFRARRDGEAWPKLLALGALYIPLGLGSLVWLYDEIGIEMVLWLLLTVWAMDIGGYVVGTLVKGPKLAPKISPCKTWSGFAGGIVLALAASWAFTYVVYNTAPTAFIWVFAVAVAVLAQIGDLLESAIKRKLGIKDSGSLIPGHGGVFDRLDALIFAAPLAYLYFRFFDYFFGF